MQSLLRSVASVQCGEQNCAPAIFFIEQMQHHFLIFHSPLYRANTIISFPTLPYTVPTPLSHFPLSPIPCQHHYLISTLPYIVPTPLSHFPLSPIPWQHHYLIFHSPLYQANTIFSFSTLPYTKPTPLSHFRLSPITCQQCRCCHIYLFVAIM